MSVQSIHIQKPIQQILLQNEPILSRIEKSIHLEPGSLKLMKKEHIICEKDPSKLKDVGKYLKNELKGFHFFMMKIKLENDLNEATFSNYFNALKARHKNLANVKDALYYSKNNVNDYYFYSLFIYYIL